MCVLKRQLFFYDLEKQKSISNFSISKYSKHVAFAVMHLSMLSLRGGPQAYVGNLTFQRNFVVKIPTVESQNGQIRSNISTLKMSSEK